MINCFLCTSFYKAVVSPLFVGQTQRRVSQSASQYLIDSYLKDFLFQSRLVT
jgi:hypothetical protein